MLNFLKDTSGNVALSLALLGLPVMATAGAAIDYTQLNRKNSMLQDAVDAAALSVGRTMLTSNRKQIRKDVREFLETNLSAEQYAEIKKLRIRIQRGKQGLLVEAKAEHPTSFLSVAGIEKLKYSPAAQLRVPNGNLEVVMVLDSTMSMSVDSKMQDLKSAANKFVDDILELNEEKERVKIGIVPFAQYVNVGLDNRNASWLDVPDDHAKTWIVEERPVLSKSGCRKVTRYNDGVAYKLNHCPDVTYGALQKLEKTKNYTWSGCVGSREYPLNLQDRNYRVKVPGLLNTPCPNRITQLTNSTGKLKDEINALEPHGSTYLPTGLIWGLRTISSGKPFRDGTSYGNAARNGTQKAIVLMSDGENQSSVNPQLTMLHNGNNSEQSNEWTLEVCENIKAKNIRIFTIGFGKDLPEETIDLLKSCSTNGTSYFGAIDAHALHGAFGEISARLTNLYLSR